MKIKSIKNQNNESRIKNGGFTLVETLVAIAILMIAIAGPLTIANQALTAALGSRDSMVATYLAQEGIESIMNIKDNQGSSNFSNVFSSSCSSGSPCQINNAWSLSGYQLNSNAGTNTCPAPYSNCKVYTDSNNEYSYDSGGQTTPFTRYYYVTPESTTVNGVTVTDYIVTVVVDWNEGSIPNEIKLQDLMTSAML